ncbi:MAG: helix-hairpin-helix domain-containing protein [Chloroflexi bacterium]|nr:helix-hairpin-helix domain-containing protein [Chloroflexota bacterium]
MNFKVTPDTMQKLSLLDDATRFEPGGSEPLEEKSTASLLRKSKILPCVAEAMTPTGKKPILMGMMTTACERNCHYCVFRAGRSKTQRITFTPDEMASSFDTLQRAGQVDGIFLSSGIIKGSITTQDKIIATAELLRKKYNYRGYVHLKVMPGADYEQVRRTMQLADRVSVNLEGATAQRLSALAPKKDFWTELVQRLQWTSQIRQQEQWRVSVVSQFVVGAVGDTDLELLSMSEKLYRQLGLRRTYYSAFRPVSQTPFESLQSTPAEREHRLYQASFLLRDYGWNLEDLPFTANTNLRLDVDPKRAWAEQNLQDAPIEINRATRDELLHIPGIGPKTADAILAARPRGLVTDLAHLRALGLRDVEKASPFILLNGRQPAQQISLF